MAADYNNVRQKLIWRCQMGFIIFFVVIAAAILIGIYNGRKCINKIV
jgi:hypothetical protein